MRARRGDNVWLQQRRAGALSGRKCRKHNIGLKSTTAKAQACVDRVRNCLSSSSHIFAPTLERCANAHTDAGGMPPAKIALQHTHHV